MNRRSVKTLALALLLGLPASSAALARSSEPSIEVSASAATSDTLPPASIRLGKVTVTPDIVYSTLPGYRPLLLDLYRPDGTAARPLVIFLHGGSWTTGSKRASGHFTDFPGVLASLAERGFAVASVDYRFSGEARFPAALNDIKAAIRFLRANAGQFAIDPSRVAVWGASAGAHLAAMTAFTGDDLDFTQPGIENAEQSDRAQAFVGWYGPYDMSAIFRLSTATPSPADAATAIELPGPPRFFGCRADDCPPSVIEQASPINFVDRNDPPTLLIHGSADTAVPASQSKALDERLKAAGVRTKLVIIDGVNHEWSGKELPTTANASRKAIAETFDWLERTMMNGQ